MGPASWKDALTGEGRTAWEMMLSNCRCSHKEAQFKAAGACTLLPVPIEEVTHVGEEHDTPVADDPRHNVVRGGLKSGDALPPPLDHGVDKLS
eukprot:12122993-Alexandrium_andersonii.AAC.1